MKVDILELYVKVFAFFFSSFFEQNNKPEKNENKSLDAPASLARRARQRSDPKRTLHIVVLKKDIIYIQSKRKTALVSLVICTVFQSSYGMYVY